MNNEHFIELLKEQLDLEAKLKDLRRRIGQALEAARQAGNNDRILISHEGEVYGLERPAHLRPADRPDDAWEFHCKGKLL
jgi:hypothetical protein